MSCSAVAMIGANLRYGSVSNPNSTLKNFQCHPGGATEATLMFSLGALGMGANIILMGLILMKRQLRRWSQGLLFHQAMVDCARAAILLPLGFSIYKCQPVNKCSLVETAFLLLVTVSTVNMLTTVLNDSPVFPEDERDDLEQTAPLLMDSPQCVLFGAFMIWFASITINLGPTFLSGALAANSESRHNAPSCPLVHGPFRHYVLNVLWIFVNVVCVFLTLFHLHKLYKDLTKANVEAVRVAGLVTTLVSVTSGANRGNGNGDGSNPDVETGRTATEEHRRMQRYLRRMEKEGVQRVKMFVVITAAYVLFWGPLFFVTLVHHPVIGSPIGYEITLHVACVHAFINPTLFMVLHRGLRQAVLDICCGACTSWGDWLLGPHPSQGETTPPRVSTLLPPPPPQPAVSLLKPPSNNKQRISPMGNENMIYTDGVQSEPWAPTSSEPSSATRKSMEPWDPSTRKGADWDPSPRKGTEPWDPATRKGAETWDSGTRQGVESWVPALPETVVRKTPQSTPHHQIEDPNRINIKATGNPHGLRYSPELEFNSEQCSSVASSE